MRPELLSAKLVNTIGRIPAVGSALRWYADRFEDGSVVQIATGHAAGLKWKRYHNHVNGYWTGQYEFPIQQALSKHLRSGYTFYDVGANAGFFSLLAARLVGPAGRVYSFEPLPENVTTLREQISINSLANCQVIETAVSDRSGRALFLPAADNAMGHLLSSARKSPPETNASPATEVTTISIDDFVGDHRAPDMMKIDVEGAEASVLAGAGRLLTSTGAPVLLIELHGEQKAASVDSILRSHGYGFTDLSGNPLPSARGQHHVLSVPLDRLSVPLDRRPKYE
jgi:FkbM family methyltransferase